MSFNTKTNKSITHIIFDLDGTLIDTEIWGLNNLNTLLSSYGKHCTTQTYSGVLGLGTLDRAQRLIQEFGLECDSHQFHTDWVTECRQHLTDIQLMPGVKRLVEHLHSHDIPLAIATSGKTLEFIAKTNHLEDIFKEGKYFGHVVHGDDERVKRIKPFPDILEVCAAQFTPTPQHKNILVIEDNLNGISAAVSAGMPSVLVNDKRFTEYKDTNADLVINSLEEFDPQLFGFPPYL